MKFLVPTYFLTVSLLFNGISLTSAQSAGFDFGKVIYKELDMKIFERDTSAVAVILDEFGEARFDLESLNKIIFDYHIKIKVLKEAGKKYADFEIAARKSSSTRQEIVRLVKASTYNREGNAWKESALQSKNIFNENVNSDYSLTKFAVPDVRVGSVFEVSYQLESPFTFNFVPWNFQSDIPKIKSEFWAQYPAYYQYNISLKGFLSLTKSESSAIKQCSISGVTSVGTTAGADCTQLKFGMTNIPAFKEEEFMTAKRNFLSAINFELAKITHQDGHVDKITTEWKEAEKEMREDENFGVQIKRARNIFEEKAKEVITSEKDPMGTAKALHDYFKNNFLWNGDFGFLTDKGVKKTAELKTGNVADLNLSLLGALLEAKITAEPVLLSTRARGLPIKLYPVLSDFNYVVVRVKINNEFYFLDVTNSFNSFGFLPERCLNGQGRALGETSDWIDLKPNSKERTIFDLKLSLNTDGQISGNASISHFGYAAYNIRQTYSASNNEEAYIQKRKASWTGLEIKNFNIENQKDLEKPFVEKFELTFEDQTSGATILYFQPFIFKWMERNPFQSNERLFPVDFGAPTEVIHLISLEIPEGYTTEDLPGNVALTLPNSGGRFLFSVNKLQGKLNISCNLFLNKSVYTADEYHYVRELFTRYIAVQQTQLVLKKG